MINNILPYLRSVRSIELVRKNAARYLFVALLIILFSGGLQQVTAQQSDTTQTEKVELDQREQLLPYHSERSTNSFLLPESGTYNVPEPTEYYQPPFMGQKRLDEAVAAYRKELENSIANTPLFQFISTIAPFVNNQFEFGVYRIYDLPIVERDNPLLAPQIKEEKP